MVRRSISQQKSGVSITIDDPIRTTRQPSPSRGKPSNIIHVTNLVGTRHGEVAPPHHHHGVTRPLCCFPQVRPFTLGQLKELLNRTGTVVEEGFWIDKIKSHCFVTVSTAGGGTGAREKIQEANPPAPRRRLSPTYDFALPSQYASTEEAAATREALHRVKWPLSNPKVLHVDFCQQDEVGTLSRGRGPGQEVG